MRLLPFFNFTRTVSCSGAAARVARLVKTSVDQAERHGYSLVGLEKRRVPSLFFGVLPLVFFLLLKGSWVTHYKVDARELEEEFFRHFSSIARSLGPVVLKKRK